MDAWVFQPSMMLPGTKWCPWFPVDSSPIPKAVARHVVQAYERIVFSRFGEQMVRDAGMDCLYVPHATETNVYKPGSAVEARRQMGLPEDAFIVGMVAANKGAPSRKAFVPQLRAFAQLKAAHPDRDVRMYLHTTTGAHNEYGGENLPEYLEHLGLTHAEMGSVDAGWADIIFCNQYLNILGFSDEQMATVFNAFDVYLNVAMGEGFGVGILDAQSCGTPVIVGGWTAMQELCWSGWAVPIERSEPMWTGVAAYQFYPHWRAIYERLEEAYDALANPKYAKKLRTKARNGALDYDADLVTDRYWKPALEHIEARIQAEKRTLIPKADALTLKRPEGEAAK